MAKQDGHFSQSFNPAALKAAYELHGNTTAVEKFDGANYKDDGRTAKLSGPPPGYTPFDNTKPLISEKRRPINAAKRSFIVFF